MSERPKADPVREDFLDFPTAWRIQNEVGPSLGHHPKCSSVEGSSPGAGPHFLCDCGAVPAEWQRRVAAQIDTSGGAA